MVPTAPTNTIEGDWAWRPVEGWRGSKDGAQVNVPGKFRVHWFHDGLNKKKTSLKWWRKSLEISLDLQANTVQVFHKLRPRVAFSPDTCGWSENTTTTWHSGLKLEQTFPATSEQFSKHLKFLGNKIFGRSQCCTYPFPSLLNKQASLILIYLRFVLPVPKVEGAVRLQCACVQQREQKLNTQL